MNSAPTATPYKILVLGAGLSGLAAAYELVQHGHDVKVLEAASRPGGRIQTLREPFADGLWADAGAMLFANNDTHVNNYARLFDLPMMAMPAAHDRPHYFLRRDSVVTSPGQTFAHLNLTAEERELGADGLFEKYLVTGVLDTPVDPLDPQWPPDALKSYDSLTGRDFLKQRGASDAAIELLGFGLLNLMGEGLASYSALSMLAIVTLALGTDLVSWLQGGSDLLPKAFAARLSGHIHYGARVTKIESSDTSVRVSFLQGSTTQTKDADYVVTTIPFSVLKSVEFSPPLSPQKQTIVANLGMTSVTRTFLTMRERFWEEQLFGEVLTKLPVACLLSACPLHVKRGILETYSSGKEARTLASMDPQQRLDYALAQAAQIFPQAIDHYEGGASKCWDQDENARGAYAYFKPGQLLAFLPYLGAAEGRIHFAGDHTTPLPGWSNAALFSGRRAAAEISAL